MISTQLPQSAATIDPLWAAADDDAARGLPRERAVEPATHFHRPVPRMFTARERATTTILFTGLTWKHGRLIQATLEGLGYRCQELPDPDRRAFQLGKEYGNTGQCNPTHFGTGSLIQFLQAREAAGMDRQQISERYVFLTAGACGPCRFGMYEAEFRLALRNAGFDGFRVILFQQHGLSQAGEEAGVKIDADFMLALLMSFVLADLVNDIAYQIRPYEVQRGATDEALAMSIEELHGLVLQRVAAVRQEPGLRWLENLPGSEPLRVGLRLRRYLHGRDLTAALDRIARRFGQIAVDRTQTRPIVKTTGEFWAQTTEGDGNFGMLGFLESEGAEVVADPVSAWLPFSVHQARVKARDRLTFSADFWPRLKTLARLIAVDRLYASEWRRLRRHMGNMPRLLPDQIQLRKLADPFFNYRSGGGEGHLEVGKNIYYHTRRMCHMVLSLKPFGCLPSTQSDGAQSAVACHYDEMIYLPIETSGEGEVNAHSRVQMALSDARSRARIERDYALAWSGVTLDEVRAHVAQNPSLQQAAYRVPKSDQLASVAANFICHVARRMGRITTDGPAEPAPAETTPLLQIDGVEAT
jgi:predicted nucleotide-binding protein (sugar kinase/HSP70/actin superfamily)